MPDAKQQLLETLSHLKSGAMVYHTGKHLKACGLTVEGADDKYHGHTVSKLRELLTSQTDFAEPDTFTDETKIEAQK